MGWILYELFHVRKLFFFWFDQLTASGQLGNLGASASASWVLAMSSVAEAVTTQRLSVVETIAKENVLKSVGASRNANQASDDCFINSSGVFCNSEIMHSPALFCRKVHIDAIFCVMYFK